MPARKTTLKKNVKKRKPNIDLKKVDPFYYFLQETIAEEARRQRKAKRENPELYAELVRTQFKRIKAKLRKKKKELKIKYTGISI
jgi:hypothetical protein